MFDDIYEWIWDIEEQKRKLEQEIKETVVNKKYPLKKRWKLFCDTDFGEEQSWCVEFEKFDNDFWFETMGKSRHEFINLKEELSEAIEDLKLYDTGSKKEVERFQEYCLEKFIKGFILDW